MDSHVEKAIFVGGCPRSGTTYLASLLANFPGVIVTPESKFKHACISEYEVREKLRKKTIESRFNRDFYFRLWECPFPNGAPDVFDQSAYRWLMNRLINDYANKVGFDRNYDTWVDHTPSNLGSGKFLMSLYPKAKFVHIVRDPRAVISSLIDKDWGPHDLMAASDYWLTKISVANAFCARYPDVCMTVRYEDLIEDTANTINSVARFCEFKTHDVDLNAMAGVYQVPTYSMNQHRLVCAAPDQSRVDGWLKEINAVSLLYIEKKLRSYLALYGYAPLGESLSHVKFFRLKLCLLLFKQKFQSAARRRRRKHVKRQVVGLN